MNSFEKLERLLKVASVELNYNESLEGNRADIWGFHIALWRFNLIIGKLHGLD